MTQPLHGHILTSTPGSITRAVVGTDDVTIETLTVTQKVSLALEAFECLTRVIANETIAARKPSLEDAQPWLGNTGLTLTTRDDLGDVIGSWVWREDAPSVLTVAMRGGRLDREDVEALRNYCDAVLGNMDVAEMQRSEEAQP